MSKIGVPITDSDIKNIYNNYHPAVNNLFKVEISVPSENQISWTSYNKLTEETDISNYVLFHATSVTLGGESLKLDRDQITKNFAISAQGGYSRADSITITWREADDWKVRKYHESWLNKFYNREEDHYISYDKDAVDFLYRTIKITLPPSWAHDGTNSTDNQIVCVGVLPNNFGDISLSWSNSGGIVTYTQTYSIKNWYWSGTVYNVKPIPQASTYILTPPEIRVPEAFDTGIGRDNL